MKSRPVAPVLTTELNTSDIPVVYRRFAEVVGDGHWKKRVTTVKEQIKGNRFLDKLLRAENDIAFQLEHLRNLSAKYGVVPQSETANEAIYGAAALAAQTLSIMDMGSVARGFDPKPLVRVDRRKFAMRVNVQAARVAPSVDQCAAAIPASASTLTQRGERFMSTSNFMRRPA